MRTARISTIGTRTTESPPFAHGESWLVSDAEGFDALSHGA